MNFEIKKDTYSKIQKSKEIIKKEKQKIKEEQKKLRKEKREKKRSKEEKNEVFSLKEQIISMIYFEIIGAILCLLVLFALSGGKNYFRLYKELNKLINIYDTITSNYYGDLDKEEIIDSAIESMMNSIGDDYTNYTDDDASENPLEKLEGSYEGIGLSVSTTMDKEIIVASVFKDGPAAKAGIEVNDIIIKVDGYDFSNKTSDEMATYIKKSSNSTVDLTIRRNNEEKEMTVTREKVEIPSVSSTVITKDDKKIGYIDISIFSAVTYNQFKKQLEALEKENIEGLVIDVRSDTGGYLTCVTDISKLFLKKGQIIYQLKDDNITEKIKDTTKEHRQYPIVVLINDESASASEILAAAIKESYGGIVVGTPSFGKGTVQKTQILKDGSMIKYTTQNWLTPNGNWINEVGVKPTIEVELDLSQNSDNQLEVAIDEIINKIN